MNITTHAGATPRFNRVHAAGAIFAALVAIVHFASGVALIMPPVEAAAEIHAETRALMDVVWLDTGLGLTGAAALLGWSAAHPDWRRPAGWIVGAYYVAGTALILVVTLAWFGSLLALPQWIAFGPIAGLAFLGLRRA